MKLITSFFDSKQDFISTSTEYIVEQACINVKEKGFFTIALAGGTTPLQLYENLVNSPFKEKFPWEKTYFFLGDERILPSDSANSNFFMIEQSLFSKIDIKTDNKIMPNISLETTEKIAKDYESRIKDFFNADKLGFDLVLLGMGLDCHTASLFPADPIWKNNKDFVISTSSPMGKPNVHRISIGLSLINQSKNILILTSGQEKKEIAQKLLKEINENKNSINSPILEICNLGEFVWHIN